MRKRKISHREYLNYYEQNKGAEDFLANVKRVFGIPAVDFVRICLWQYRRAAYPSFGLWAAHAKHSIKCSEYRKSKKNQEN